MKFNKFKTGGMLLLAFLLFVLPQTSNAANKNILRYGSTYAVSDYGNGESVVQVRLVQQGSIRYWQMRLPGGFWDSCDGDCSEAYRRKLLDFWETIDEDSPTSRNRR